MSTRHPNTNVQWTTEEIATLLSLKNATVHFKDIGKQLGRTPAACSTKYYEIKRDKPWLLDNTVKPEAVQEPAPTATPYSVETLIVGAAIFAAGLIIGLYI